MCSHSARSPSTSASNKATRHQDHRDIPWTRRRPVASCGVTTGFGARSPGRGASGWRRDGASAAAASASTPCRARRSPAPATIIAVDPVEFKREQSQLFGATHVFASIEEAAALLGKVGRNAEKVIMTTGVAEGDMVAPMMSLVGKGGRAVVTSVANMHTNDVQLNLFDLAMQQKQLVGTIFSARQPTLRRAPAARPLPERPAQARRAHHRHL